MTRRRRPKITRDEQPAIEEAIKLIRRARRLLRDAGATKAANRLTRALKSAEGALRQAVRVPLPDIGFFRSSDGITWTMEYLETAPPEEVKP